MKCVNKSLVLFTAQFPFGQVSETFLETEIVFLSYKFEKIYIIPSCTGDYVRQLPDNVIVNTDYSNCNISKSQKRKTIIFNFSLACIVLFSELKDKGLGKLIRNKSILLDYLAQQLVFKKKIEAFVLKQHSETVFYDYWFCNKTLALAMIKKHNQHLKFVSRAHGFDLYDERWTSGVPYRRFKSRNMNKIYFVSQDGYDYFKVRVGSRIEEKMKLARLGSLPNEVSQIPKGNASVPVIVSVSRVIMSKNVNQIPILLSELNRPIKWIHFGDGVDMDNVRAACRYLPDSIDFELKGHISNQEMIAFFQNNQIDLFISLSSSEGLPVSMMEAQSFGIPILSTAVGGVPEIVINGKTGFLIREKENALETLNQALNYYFSKQEIISFFNEHFNASVNYSKFADNLCCLEN